MKSSCVFGKISPDAQKSTIWSTTEKKNLIKHCKINTKFNLADIALISDQIKRQRSYGGINTRKKQQSG